MNLIVLRPNRKAKDANLSNPQRALRRLIGDASCGVKLARRDNDGSGSIAFSRTKSLENQLIVLLQEKHINQQSDAMDNNIEVERGQICRKITQVSEESQKTSPQ